MTCDISKGLRLLDLLDLVVRLGLVAAGWSVCQSTGTKDGCRGRAVRHVAVSASHLGPGFAGQLEPVTMRGVAPRVIAVALVGAVHGAPGPTVGQAKNFVRGEDSIGGTPPEGSRTPVAAALTQVHNLTLLCRVYAVGGWL